MLRQTFKRLSAIALCAVLAPACGGGSGGGASGSLSQAPGPSINDTTHPFITPGTPGTRTLITRGGAGSGGNGGSGNFIIVRSLAGSNARILPTGSVNVAFTVPAGGPGLGPNPLTISANTTLGVGTGLTLGSTAILGDDGLTTATGLHVLPGITLTLEPNFDLVAPLAVELDTASLSFSAGVLIEGKIVGGFRQGSTLSRSGVTLNAAALRVSSAGSIDTAGEDAAPGNNGGSGGRITLQANAGVTINQGTLISSGGSGDVGGAAGPIDLFSTNFAVFSTGTLTAVGGIGNVGVGGNGGQLWMAASFNGGAAFGGGAHFSGTANASGGDGETGGGNSATFFMNVTGMAGPLVFNGTATMSGGNAITSGNGGSVATGFGGFTSVGTVRASGSIISKGGNGAAGGNGGTGGQIFFWCRVDGFGNPTQPVGDGMFVSVSADSSGGTGAVGGIGRDIQFLMEAGTNTVRPGAMPLWLVGYTGFDSSGGNGTGNGGNGGQVHLRNQVALDSGGTPWLGSLFNEVNVVARGGDGAGGTGGNGGAAVLTTDATAANRVAGFLDRLHVNSGDFDLRGGTGATNGGIGGSFTLDSTFRIENYGDILTTGGTGTAGSGGAGGAIRLSSDGVTINDGALTANGGGSTFIGGSGAAIVVEGRTASHTGAINSQGGGGGGALLGGNGGVVTISSWDGAVLSSISAAVIGVQAGSGAIPGVEGTVTVDGVSLTLTAGSISFP